ncbi:MAG: GNAT family N-acetyltransferase [Bacillota bacterium]
MKGISIKPFQSGDEDIYLDLYNYVHPKNMSIDIWRWKNLNGPLGRSIIVTAWDGNTLVGIYGIVPVMLYEGGNLIKGGLSDIAVTHPDYRYRGIFSALGKSLYERAAGQGIEIVYGFPTEHSVHGFKGSLGWEYLAIDYVLCCWGCDDTKLVKSNNYNVYQNKNVSDAFDKIWKRVTSGTFKNYIILQRSKIYLEWRFNQHPEINYNLYVADDNEGIPVGYAAVCFGEEGGEKYCDIVDIITYDIACFRSMVSYFITNFGELMSLRIRIPSTTVFYDTLKGMGFKESGKKYYFGSKLLKNFSAGVKDWYCTACDNF